MSQMVLFLGMFRKTVIARSEATKQPRTSRLPRPFGARNDDTVRVLLSILSTILLILFFLSPLYGSEVIEDTHTRVVVREHPKTGKPYVSIVSADKPLSEDPFAGMRGKMSRPNYRMLDPKVKPGEIPYEGPYSSSTKIYVFAATLATLGVAGGAIGMAAIPASAATTGAASGGAAYVAAGSAVAVGTVAATEIATRPNPKGDDFVQVSKSKSVETKDGMQVSEVTSSKESE